MTNPIVKMVSMDELKGEAKKIYQGFITKGKKVPKWVEVMANCEDILVGFFTMFKATMDDAPLPAILKWKVADEVSRLNQCELCHSRPTQAVWRFRRGVGRLGRYGQRAGKDCPRLCSGDDGEGL